MFRYWHLLPIDCAHRWCVWCLCRSHWKHYLVFSFFHCFLLVLHLCSLAFVVNLVCVWRYCVSLLSNTECLTYRTLWMIFGTTKEKWDDLLQSWPCSWLTSTTCYKDRKWEVLFSSRLDRLGFRFFLHHPRLANTHTFTQTDDNKKQLSCKQVIRIWKVIRTDK